MSANCDGGNSKSPKLSKKCVGSFEKPVSLDDKSGEDFAPEAAFRGFEKTPLVLLFRSDISPYLKRRKSIHSSRRNYSDSFIHNKRLTSTCVVKLSRDDLEKLKNAIKVKQVSSEVSDSSDLDADFDVNMASKCNICEKLYASEKKLLKHQSKKHMIVYEKKPQKRVSFSDHVIIHELKEYHKCRKCTKIFENYKFLKRHMKQCHKKRKCYICNYCNKTFVDRMFFKVHIKSHCDLCGQFFYSRAFYQEHRRTVCRVIKLHKCKDCELSFFKIMDLKDHSYEHTDSSLICDICKDHFTSKCALAHHISFLHSKKRPSNMFVMRNLGTERLYLCNFCEESSVDKNLLEIHLQSLPDLTNRAMTGYKDYYFCDQCMKKFQTETDMLQHKWTHFLKTSDNSQTRIIVENDTNNLKQTFRLGEKLPESMNPVVMLKKINILDTSGEPINNIDLNTFRLKNRPVGCKPGPRSKKSPPKSFQCPTCSKYYSTNYCLNRHIETQHRDYVNLKCNVCKESFVWPSMLDNHKCAIAQSELPEHSITPEIYFDNIHQFTQNGLDDFNITENDDYLNSVDFDIPAPIVEFNEGYNNYNNINRSITQIDKSCVLPIHNLNAKIIIQEVPIEF